MTRYQKVLGLLFCLVWSWSAWQPRSPQDWWLENLLVIGFVPLLFLLGRYFRLSELSYSLLTLFLILHVIGAHYTYAEVPFGYTLQRWLGSSRNMYDRLVHCAFGLLFAYPVREIVLRIAKVKGFWGLYLPFDVVVAFSGAFEMVEWVVASLVNPEAGTAYLGTQGDEWDAQKDMFVATAGAAGAMLVTALVNWRLNPDFGRELRESFQLSSNDAPLGEERVKSWLRRTARARDV